MTEQYPIEYDAEMLDKQRDAVSTIMDLFPHAEMDQDADGYYVLFLNWEWDPAEAEEE